jgi:hypothetical protein
MERRQGAGGKTILVDRDALLTYMQYSARTFDPARAAESLDGLDESELAALVDNFVREEVLYREALALGLDRNDFVIRQRLIQKLEFINRDLTEEMMELTDAEIQRYFAGHRDRYMQPARITFTHIFLGGREDGARAGGDDAGATGLDDAQGDGDSAISRAESLLAELNARQVTSGDALRYGDELVHGAEFVEQSPEEIASLFGQEFSDAVFALDPQPDRWQGPLPSSLGSHLVLIARLTPERMLELAEAEKTVREDARRDRIDERNRAILQEMVDTYDVQVTVQAGSSGTPEETSGSRP